MNCFIILYGMDVRDTGLQLLIARATFISYRTYIGMSPGYLVDLKISNFVKIFENIWALNRKHLL